jgi:TetR/AcrR family tetracycline transcriptional repressor
VTLVISEPGKTSPLSGDAKDEMMRGKRAQLDSLDPKRFPHLLESAEFFLFCDDEETYFRRGIDFLVAGTRGVQHD